MRTPIALSLLLLPFAVAQGQQQRPPHTVRPRPRGVVPAPGGVQPPGYQPSRANPPGSPGPGPAIMPAPVPGPVTPGGPAPSAETPGASTGIGASRADGRCIPLKGRFLISFNKAEIVDVIEQASRWTCRNFAFTEDIARGKITLLSRTPVNAQEAYAAFLASLSANGIAVYPTGKYYKLVRLAETKKTPIPTMLDDGREAPSLEQPLTKVIRLRYADADQLRGVMSNFISSQGADIQSIPPDVLIITDIGLNIRRIEKLISAVDKAGSGDLIRVFQVQYAVAKDLAEKVNQVFTAAPGQPGRQGLRRQVFGYPQGAAPQPGMPAPGGPGGEPSEVSISKVLADDRTNKLIIIADDKSFQRIIDLVKQLDIPTSGDGTIHVVFLKNANAEDLAQTLQALAQGQSSARRSGSSSNAPPPAPGAPPGTTRPAGATSADLLNGEVKITSDKQQNALVVMANAADFETIQRLIDKLDRPRRQVFIEAVIMEVDIDHTSSFGVSAHAAIPYKTGSGTGIIPLSSQPAGTTASSLNPLSIISANGFLTGLVGPISADLKDLGLNIPSMGVLIQALQTSNDVNVLSTPNVLASDNEEAEIAVGSNVPFPGNAIPSNLSSLTSATSSTSTAAQAASLLSGVNLYPSIQRQNVELKLKIKPQINEGDMVRLELDEQTEDIASNDPVLGPTTSKRSVKTKIVAKDQHTIVIGGLIQERVSRSVSKVPLLGDIPLIGALFRHTDTEKRKTNLLLFLTPYIVRDESDYRRIYERKRREQQEFMEQFYGQKSTYNLPIDFARKSGAYTQMHRQIVTENLKLENGGPGLPGERVVGPESRKRGAAGLEPAGAPATPAASPPAKPAKRGGDEIDDGSDDSDSPKAP